MTHSATQTDAEAGVGFCVLAPDQLSFRPSVLPKVKDSTTLPRLPPRDKVSEVWQSWSRDCQQEPVYEDIYYV